MKIVIWTKVCGSAKDRRANCICRVTNYPDLLGSEGHKTYITRPQDSPQKTKVSRHRYLFGRDRKDVKEEVPFETELKRQVQVHWAPKGNGGSILGSNESISYYGNDKQISVNRKWVLANVCTYMGWERRGSGVKRQWMKPGRMGRGQIMEDLYAMLRNCYSVLWTSGFQMEVVIPWFKWNLVCKHK